MSLTATKKPPPPLTSSPYPFAAAPDIIRAHQKDAYFQGVLTNQLTDLHRRVRGARSAHSWATETRTAADLLYLCLTTLIGNRTLGEEYCDLVQVEEPSPGGNGSRISPDAQHPIELSSEAGGPRLPSLQRRAGYIVSSVLVPYLFGRLLPSIRAFLRKRLQDRLTVLARQGRGDTKGATPSSDSKGSNSKGFSTVSSLEYRVKRYLLTHLTSITSGAHLHALTLAVFYFSGAYYSFSKRLFGLRYVFTRRIEEGQGGRAGYEVLGVLLVVQMLVRGYLHVTAQLSSTSPLSAEEANTEAGIRERAFGPGTMNVSLDENAYSSNNELLVGEVGAPGSGNQRSLAEIGRTTHTPVPKGGRARYDLAANEEVMGWIKGRQQRMCTLCLEELKDPAATQCGHVFCWSCIGDWVREKPECPLCRRETMVQHILPLRVA
ncbi:Pex12 amino terminal region-domain-containing protein [Sordaria brevicollis]|uniref:RING-type E3 ubiquitin transferase n=1 Tax=Sordaria brevicollis TaxID=83679 RepID=A0AAE0UC23_SORBR|nr:Pex12 amino terminal region-domain-containing protein [Sordaria brevicollis]